MKIASIQHPVFNPYNSATVEIYISGCNRKCKNCCNPELQDFNYGQTLDINILMNYLSSRSSLYDNISFVGGDLLEQDSEEAERLIKSIRKSLNYTNPKNIWLFTGASEEELPNWVYEVFDYIKIGKYIEELKQEGFPASSNQKLLTKGKDY